jgi:hypothetical protein
LFGRRTDPQRAFLPEGVRVGGGEGRRMGGKVVRGGRGGEEGGNGGVRGARLQVESAYLMELGTRRRQGGRGGGEGQREEEERRGRMTRRLTLI